jgi:hypothetical protein
MSVIIRRVPALCELRVMMITETKAGTSPAGQSACSAAEDRGFESRRAVKPNRISSAPASVSLRSAYSRETAEPQASGTGNLSNLPGRAGFSPGVRACLVRARCVRPAYRHALVKSTSP